MVPETPAFEFMRRTKFRVKTIALRQQISQGLVLPLSILPDGDWKEDDDVTDVLGVIKYEKPIPQGSNAVGNFCPYVNKTDETRIQNAPWLLDWIKDRATVFTIKEDGTSATFCKKDGEFTAYSRNFQVGLDGENVYAKIGNQIRDLVPEGFVVQGEIAGIGVQGNRAQYKSLLFKVFNVFDIEGQRYYHHDDLLNFCSKNGLTPVDEAFRMEGEEVTLEELLEKADNTKYSTGRPAEGIVCRLLYEDLFVPKLCKNLSFKVISNKYLLKNGE